MNVELRPLNLKDANDFVTRYHRHNKAVVGHRFSIGLSLNDELVGVAIVGRPIARLLDNEFTAEITRLCVNENAPLFACSKLYRACIRTWSAMGGKKIITYTLQIESGSSLRGVGFKKTADILGAQWSRPYRPREMQEIYKQDKFRWEIECCH